ncbi:MAG: hypothetical protein AAF360_02755 [Pseudomonadota bacterium]
MTRDEASDYLGVPVEATGVRPVLIDGSKIYDRANLDDYMDALRAAAGRTNADWLGQMDA